MDSQLNAASNSFPVIFDKYLLLDLLAEGPSGKLYSASLRANTRPDVLVAVKCVCAGSSDDDARLAQRWQQAARRSARVVHPALCRIHDVGKSEGWLFVCTELVAGLDLSRIHALLKRRERPLPVDYAALVVSQVASALCAAHNGHGAGSEPVIHGDLKLSNLLIGWNGAVKVIDLGLGAVLSERETGTPQQPSTSGPNGSDATRKDVSSLGACLLELLDLHGAAVPPRTLTRKPPSDHSEASGSSALRAIARRALEPKPGARLASAAALRQALEEFMATRRAAVGAGTLRDWMRTEFAAEWRVNRERLERAAARATVNPVAVSREASGLRQTEAARAPTAHPKAAPIKMPPPMPPSREHSSDPDITPARGALVEGLAATMLRSAELDPTPAADGLKAGSAAVLADSRPTLPSMSAYDRTISAWRTITRFRPTALAWAVIGGSVALMVLMGLALGTREQPETRVVTSALEQASPGSWQTSSAPREGPASQVQPIAASQPAPPPRSQPAPAPALSHPQPPTPLQPSPRYKPQRERPAARKLRAADQSIDPRAARIEASEPVPPETSVTTPTTEVADEAPAVPATPANPYRGTAPELGASGSEVGNAALAARDGPPPTQTPLEPAASLMPARVEVREATPLVQDAPRFPARARRRGVHSGNVSLTFSIDRSGAVRNPLVVQADPPGIFDEAALEAVTRWQYRPRLLAGVPVDTHGVRVRLLFSEAR